MATPAARIGDTTASGDAIVGPGIPTVVIEGVPASVMGDQVVGSACTGSIVIGSPTVLIGGVPAARVSSQCVGVSAGGSPSSTTVGKGAPTVAIA